MKKYLSILAITAVSLSAFAQGTIVFKNQAAAPGGTVTQWTSQSNSNLISVPKNGGFVTLLYANQGAAYTPWTKSLTPAEWLAANPAWSLIGVNAGFTTPTAGLFSGGTLTLNTSAPGAGVSAVVIGWTGAYTDFASAYTAGLAGNCFVGVSSEFTTTTGNPTTVPAGTAVSIQTAFGGLALGSIALPVPEPATFALAGLGAAAMLIFRRRK